MELSDDQAALLRAVGDLQGDSDEQAPSTAQAGGRLLEIFKARGTTYTWTVQAPWHGTSPMAIELEELGLLEVDVGMAQFVAHGAPTPTVDEYYLALTPEGRSALHALDDGS
jgi:hypothetical protein